MDVRAYNREKWDRLVEDGNPWTIPCSPETIADARDGKWSVLLTEQKSVPRDWFAENLHGVDIYAWHREAGSKGQSWLLRERTLPCSIILPNSWTKIVWLLAGRGW